MLSGNLSTRLNTPKANSPINGSPKMLFFSPHWDTPDVSNVMGMLSGRADHFMMMYTNIMISRIKEAMSNERSIEVFLFVTILIDLYLFQFLCQNRTAKFLLTKKLLYLSRSLIGKPDVIVIDMFNNGERI